MNSTHTINLPEPEDRTASVQYWNTIDRTARAMHLFEIADVVIGELGDEAISYIDTSVSTLPKDTYLADLIKSGRDIMVSLGMVKLQIPTN